MKELAAILKDLDARADAGVIARQTAEALRVMYGLLKPTARATQPAKSGRHVPNGLHARILDVLRDNNTPMPPAAVVIACKAKEWDVKLAAKELAADGKITITGATTNRRYALATKGGAK